MIHSLEWGSTPQSSRFSNTPCAWKLGKFTLYSKLNLNSELLSLQLHLQLRTGIELVKPIKVLSQ